MSAAPHIIGVRHHSPGCARLVAARLRALRPRYVLIEGPADFNARLDELFLGHELPLAIYSYLSGAGVQRGSWSPFAEHSPEWQALTLARASGASVRFIDLPAWHEAFAELPNRYADAPEVVHAQRADAYEQALADSLGIEGRDALWDHLFEQDTDTDALAAQLELYFEHLRSDDPGSPGNAAREAYMAAWIAWAMARGDGAVLVVCGGYHAPALARLWRGQPALAQEPATPLPLAVMRDAAAPLPLVVTQDGAAPPAVTQDAAMPPPAATALRHGSFLVPYSFKRLDAFQGYASGMSSPLYYQWLWECGAQSAGLRLMQDTAQRLRERRLVASTADLIALHTHAQGLAQLRGHAAPLRADWLDAAAATLLKEAQDVPLPWTYRGRIRAGTAPLLVEMMDVLAGDVRGRLAAATPQPPLLAALAQELAAVGLVLRGEQRLDLLTPAGRAKSHILHRLLLLQIPGIRRVQGPQLALSGEREELWQLEQPLEQQAALIEAGAYGATLAEAAQAALEERLRSARGDVAALAQGLNAAALAGLSGASDALLQDLREAVAAAAQFEPLGEALGLLYPLFRHGQALAMAASPLLRSVIESAFDRALWLLEPPAAIAPAQSFAHLRALIALRDLVRGQAAFDALPLSLESTRALAVFARKVHSVDSAPLSRGAALGALLSLPQAEEQSGLAALDLTTAVALLRALAPEQLGDALSGLLALAREQLSQREDFIAEVDGLIVALDDSDFLQALPALRGAFAWLPARERGRLASLVLRLHAATQLPQSALTAALPAGRDAQQLARAMQREKTIWARLQSWGVTAPELDP